MTSSETKSLLFAHFANKTTPLQQRMIEEWLKDEANQERFYSWLVEWENQLPVYQPELEAPLRRFVAHMETIQPFDNESIENNEEPEEVPVVALQSRRFRWMAVAASVLVMLALGGWFNRNRILYETYQTAYGETRTVQLSDGSTVTLNAHSSLRVPRFGFGDQSREVRLIGEGYFAVRHRADNQKFVVKTANGFDVIVHGTEFTVSTRMHRANVMLRKGKVQVDYGVGNVRKQLMLQPGDLVTLNRPDQPQLRHRVSAQPYSAWTEHRFVFDNMTLAEFGQLLTDNYGLRVQISDKNTAQRTLVGSFQANTADELLQTVSELFDLTVTRQANTVLLEERE
jgi:transmembrane sensor